MKEDPQLSKKLREDEERHNRWIGRRIESHDTPRASSEQAAEAPAPQMTMVKEDGLEQLPVGSPARPSGQGGEYEEMAEGNINALKRVNLCGSRRFCL